MRETRCGTFELWSLLGQLLAQPMLAVCLVHMAVVIICVIAPSILPMVAWRVALGCSCIWLLYVALTTAHKASKYHLLGGSPAPSPPPSPGSDNPAAQRDFYKTEYHYVVVIQLNPDARHVLPFLPDTRDADLDAALAKLPNANDASVFDFGADHAKACAFAADPVSFLSL